MVDQLSSVDKLHGSNWFIWRMQIFPRTLKLWKQCLRTETLHQQATFACCDGRNFEHGFVQVICPRQLMQKDVDAGRLKTKNEGGIRRMRKLF